MTSFDSSFKKNFKTLLGYFPKINRISNYIGMLLFSKKTFTPPNKSKVLLFDDSLGETIDKYISRWNYETLHVRGETINFYILFRSFFHKRGGKLENYIDEYIKCVQPILIITLIDNTFSFYKISPKHKAKTLFIQNALRGTQVFGDDAIKQFKKSPQPLHVDYMCVHGKIVGDAFSKFLKGTPILIGSLKNNYFKRNEKYKPNTIAVISHFRSKYSPGYRSNSFTKANSIVFDFLSEYVQENKKELQIICSTNIKDERKVYREILNGRECDFIDQPNRYGYSSYLAVDRAEVVIGMGSTLTYESVARGNKTAFFTITNDDSHRYGFPEEVPDVGPFWTNIPDPKIFKKILDHLFEITDEEWRQDLELAKFSKHIVYDPGNTRLKEILKHELDGNVN